MLDNNIKAENVSTQSKGKSAKIYIFGTIRVILSVLLGITAAAFLCAFVILTVFRRDNVEEFIRDIDPAWIIEDIDIQGDIAETLNEIPHFYPVFDADGVDEFLKRNNVSNEINNVIDGYLDAFFNGDFNHHVTYSDVIEIARILEPDIYEQFGIIMTEEDYWILSLTLDNDEDFEALSIGNIVEQENINLNYPEYLFSIYPLVITGFLCILFFINIYIVNWKSIVISLFTTGVSVLLTGAVLITTSAVESLNIEALNEPLSLISKYIEAPLNMIYQRGFTVAVIGSALIILSIVIFIILMILKSKTLSNFKKPEKNKSKVRLIIGISVNVIIITVIIISTVLFMDEISQINIVAASTPTPGELTSGENISNNADLIVVTFDANGGSWLNGEVEIRTVNVEKGTAVGEKFPIDPQRAGHLFLGWKHSSEENFNQTQPVANNMTVRAFWIEESLNEEIDSFVLFIENVIKDSGATIQVVYTVDQINHLISGCNITLDNHTDDEITLTLNESLTITKITGLQVNERINLILDEDAVFTIGNGIVYENHGIIYPKYRSIIVVENDATLINHGEIDFSTIFISVVQRGGTLINNGSINTRKTFININGYFENNGKVSLRWLFNDRNQGSHMWIGSFGGGDDSEARAVNNGEIIIEDIQSVFSVRSGILINNARFINRGEFYLLEHGELILAEGSTFANNRIFRNSGTLTNEGGTVSGRRIAG